VSANQEENSLAVSPAIVPIAKDIANLCPVSVIGDGQAAIADFQPAGQTCATLELETIVNSG
jgi:hypothetical protein